MANTKTTESTADARPTTRMRLIEAALGLFSRHGYAATGIKAVLAAANAPYGSMYHWFPGGKGELGVAVVDHGGAHYRGLLEAQYPPDADIVEATAQSFIEVADLLEATDYADACPIATIALEVASSDEPMRAAAAAAFKSWLEVLEQRMRAAGMTIERAREVAVEVFCLMEGASLLSRTTRSSKPMHTASRAAAKAVAAGLAASSVEVGGTRRH